MRTNENSGNRPNVREGLVPSPPKGRRKDKAEVDADLAQAKALAELQSLREAQRRTAREVKLVVIDPAADEPGISETDTIPILLIPEVGGRWQSLIALLLSIDNDTQEWKTLWFTVCRIAVSEASVVDNNNLEHNTHAMSSVISSIETLANTLGPEIRDIIINYIRSKGLTIPGLPRAKDEPRLEAAATETTTPASDGPEWPSEKWKGSPEWASRKQHAIVAYLRRVWKPFIDENSVIVTREILKDKDEFAASALRGYLHYNPLPGDIRIFTSDQLREHLTKRPVAAGILPAIIA